MIKTCRRCGKKFDGYCNALYCPDCGLERKREIGRETFRRNYQPKPPRVCKCAICGKEFETQKRTLYCSHECAAQARKAQRQKRYLEHRDEILTKSREQRRQRRRRKPSSLKCQRCGREFTARAGTKYCPDCRPSVKRQWQHEYYCQKKSAVQSQLIKKCERCGTEFEKLATNVKYCPKCRPIVSAEQTRECKARARARARAARQPIRKNCERCGRPFEVFEDSRRRFCFECSRIQQIELGARLQARLKSKPRVCVKCGREFTGMAHQKTCDDCLAERKRETQRRIQERYDAQRPKPKTGKSLDDWAREAADCNLDYGTYRALIAAGRTFEQLKAEQRSPQFHSHIHSVNKN